MGLGDLLDARLIVAGCAGMEDGMSPTSQAITLAGASVNPRGSPGCWLS